MVAVELRDQPADTIQTMRQRARADDFSFVGSVVALKFLGQDVSWRNSA